MKRVLVIGCPGGGKSTFARALHDLTGLPLVHLDLLFWNADQTTVPRPVFLERMQTALQQEAWIIDGNYHSTMELRLQACDTVFFLDYPLDVCLAGAVSRAGKPRLDMPWIEPADGPDEEFISYIKGFRENQRPVVLSLLEKYSEKQIMVFHSRDEAEEYLKTCKI